VPVRDEQVRRYARHILLADVGGLGQTALLRASVRVAFRESTPTAELIAGRFLAAGGVGTLVVVGARDAQIADLVAHGPDTRVTTAGEGDEVALEPTPAWWPTDSKGDELALAYWRGSIAATRWMANVATR
jgi:hypothetical protein